MRKQHLWIVLACVAALAAFAVSFTREREPRYNGRSLSHWLEIYAEEAAAHLEVTPRLETAASAVRAIGTNAIPSLLKWIRQEPVAWRHKALAILPAPLVDNDWVRAAIVGENRKASYGFDLPGTNAVVAIPELRSMMRDTSRPETAGLAIMILSSLGEQALPEMTVALADTNYPYRSAVATWLGIRMSRDIGTNACLPPLMAATNDPEPTVRVAASEALHRLTPTARTNSPAQ